MKRKSKKTRESILKLLKTSNINKRLKIFDKINGASKKENIKILLKILEDSSWYLREKAAHRLANYGRGVVPRLKKLCAKGYWYTRASACLGLGEIADLRGLDSIVDLLLTDNNPTVIKEASQALLKMAQKAPDEFSQRLRELTLDDANVLKVLNILNNTDTKVYNMVRESMENV